MASPMCWPARTGARAAARRAAWPPPPGAPSRANRPPPVSAPPSRQELLLSAMAALDRRASAAVANGVEIGSASWSAVSAIAVSASGTRSSPRPGASAPAPRRWRSGTRAAGFPWPRTAAGSGAACTRGTRAGGGGPVERAGQAARAGPARRLRGGRGRAGAWRAPRRVRADRHVVDKRSSYSLFSCFIDDSKFC